MKMIWFYMFLGNTAAAFAYDSIWSMYWAILCLGFYMEVFKRPKVEEKLNPNQPPKIKPYHASLLNEATAKLLETGDNFMTMSESLDVIESKLSPRHRFAILVGVFHSNLLEGGYEKLQNIDLLIHLDEMIERFKTIQDKDEVFAEHLSILINCKHIGNLHKKLYDEIDCIDDKDSKKIIGYCIASNRSTDFEMLDEKYFQICGDLVEKFNLYLKEENGKI